MMSAAHPAANSRTLERIVEKSVVGFAETEYLLEDVAVVVAAQAFVVAAFGGGGAVKEGCRVVVRTGAIGQQVGCLVDGYKLHTLRRREFVGVGVLRHQHSLFHERRPDWRSGVCALQLHVGVVVVANPNHTKQAAGETAEPRVVAVSGLAGCGRDESHVADACAGSTVIPPANHAGILPIA